MNKMKNKLSLIIVFFNFLVINSQSNNPNVINVYRELINKPLKFIEFPDSLNVIQGKYKKGNHKTDFTILEISRSINLKFKKFTYTNPDSTYLRDSLFLFEKKYCLDNLYYEKRILSNEEPLRLNYASGYQFIINSKKYFSLFFWDSTIPTTNLSYFILLFDITNEKNVKIYFFDEQMSFDPNCFGDFNNDGIIDFANWTRGNNLKIMSLFGNKFKFIKNKFVVIKEKSDNTFSIDWKKSNWFKYEKK